VARLIIYGVPRTKKTKNEIHLTIPKLKMRAFVRMLGSSPDSALMRLILQRVKVQPGKLYRKWYREAVIAWEARPLNLPITVPVSVEAAIYRQRAVGDVQGFQQALGDYLEGQGILKNDRLIEHWDGTRRLKDAAVPRVELIIRECST
jgi:Holliday junction resolvase RusA-like endonuclease